MPCCCGVPPFVIQRDVDRSTGNDEVSSIDGLRLRRGIAKMKGITGTLERPCVSLYALRYGTAVFVEVPESVDVYREEAGTSFHEAQLRHAVRIYEVPIPIFRKFASHLGKPKCGCLLVSNAGHSGSALLSDALSSSLAASLLAPLALTHAAAVLCRSDVRGKELGAWLQVEVQEIVRMVLVVLLKDFRAGDFVSVVMQTQALPIAPIVQNVLPDVRQLYLYRDPEPTISSFASFANASFPRWINSLAAYSWGRRLVFGWLMPAALGDREFALLGMIDDQVGFCRTHKTEFFSREKYATHAVMWAANVRCALRILRSREMASMASLKYETLLAEPDRSCASLLRFCGLPNGDKEVKSAVAAMRNVSKEEASSSAPLKGVSGVAFSERELGLFNEIFDYFDISTNFKGSLSLPGDLLAVQAQGTL